MSSPDTGSARRAAIGIVERLVRGGHEAYLAGGCVRDELLGIEPKDYDVATDATPDRVAALFKRTREVGKSFGVMHVYEGGETIEVATFRAEGPYSDQRRPDHVTFCDAEHDAKRRDFTINALFIDPLDEASRPGGRVIDHVGGRADLDRRVVRAVGDPDERLAEDHLRALRAVRFTARLGFHLEDATAAAVRRHASELRGVSRERVGDELRAMLTHPRRAAAVSLMQRLGLDAPVLGEDALPGAGVEALDTLGTDAGFAEALASWMHDRLASVGASAGASKGPGKGTGSVTAERLGEAAGDDVRRWRDALCLTNEERSELRAILELASGVRIHWGGWSIARRKRAAASSAFGAAIRLVGVSEPQASGSILQQVRELEHDGIGLAPEPLITGDDLIASGLRPGPMFGQWLDRAYDLQLEGRLADRDQAIGRVLEWARAED